MKKERESVKSIGGLLFVLSIIFIFGNLVFATAANVAGEIGHEALSNNYMLLVIKDIIFIIISLGFMRLKTWARDIFYIICILEFIFVIFLTFTNPSATEASFTIETAVDLAFLYYIYKRRALFN